MRKIFVSLLVAGALPILQGCAAAALAGPVFGGALFLKMSKDGNKQRENCANIYDRAAAGKMSAAKTKAEAYRAGCQ